jgi:hypothetical protein
MAEAAVQATKVVPGAVARAPAASRAFVHARGSRRMFSEPGQAAERRAGARSVRLGTATCTPGPCPTTETDADQRQPSQRVAAALSLITPFGEDAPAASGPTATAELRTIDGGLPAPPAAPPAPNHCSPTSAVFTSIPSGNLPPSFTGGRFGARFDMNATFETPIPCTCVSGEYRQFVRGSFKAKGATLVHPLCGSNLSPTAWQEDCGIFGGTTYKYGYHSLPFATSRFSNPDQATGCTFTGSDFPAINSGAFTTGDVLELDLEFQGKLVDASAGDRELTSSTWSVKGTGTVS